MVVGKVMVGFVYQGRQYPPGTLITDMPIEELAKFSRMGYVLLIEGETNVGKMVQNFTDTPRINQNSRRSIKPRASYPSRD